MAIQIFEGVGVAAIDDGTLCKGTQSYKKYPHSNRTTMLSLAMAGGANTSEKKQKSLCLCNINANIGYGEYPMYCNLQETSPGSQVIAVIAISAKLYVITRISI